MTDLTAKARRAACWLPIAFEKLDAGLYADTWTVFQLEDEAKDLWGCLHCDLSDRMMIAFCKDRGWQDQDSKGVESATFNQEQEADGVEWDMKTEAASYGDLVLVVERFEDRWEWKVQEIFGDVLYPASGTAPTREEARRQAVEAACAMVRTEAQLTQEDEQ